MDNSKVDVNDSSMTSNVPFPSNSLVTPLMTDLYQITMTYAHWKNNRHLDSSVFELFFRKNPFKGEYTIFCGLDECLKHIYNFKFTKSDIEYLKTMPSLQHCEKEFFDDYLLNLTCSSSDTSVQVYALQEGTIVFPRVPMLIIHAPLGVGQLLETTLLTLINFPSLVSTNASRMVLAAEAEKQYSKANNTMKDLPKQYYQRPVCVEFGLRRAQGPDGGFSASKYSYIGGFHGTSNVLAGKLLSIPVVGTHAHAFIQSYSTFEEVKDSAINDIKLLPKVLEYRNNNCNNICIPDYLLSSDHHKECNTIEAITSAINSSSNRNNSNNSNIFSKTNDGELAAFIAYATAFPNTFLCLIDTYDTLKSGILNFILVSLVLNDIGIESGIKYTPRGVRLDSGNLAELSIRCATIFSVVRKHFENSNNKADFFNDLSIVASNDINEESLIELNRDNHCITTFGIGTNLVTCQKQPALGCVYKLVEINNLPRIKLSQDISKVLIPGKKRAYRLYVKNNKNNLKSNIIPLLDLLIGEKESPPVVGQQILCRHPFEASKRISVTPCKVQSLHNLVFDNGKAIDNNNNNETITTTNASFIPTIHETRAYVLKQLYEIMDPTALCINNPKPFKVYVSDGLYQFLHELWEKNLPIPEIS